MQRTEVSPYTTDSLGTASGNRSGSRWVGIHRTLAVVAFLFVGSASSVFGQTFNVTVGADDGTGGTANTLSWAIVQASAMGGTIDIQTDVTLSGSLIELDSANPITIEGNNHIIDGNGNQIFTVTSGDVVIQNATLTGGSAQGGAGGDGRGGGGGGLGGGGALYVGTNTPGGANVTIENVLFQNNEAVGGAGGNGDGTSANGGSGGGYNDNANSGTAGTGGAPGGAGNGANGLYGGGGAGAGASGTTGGSGNGGGSGGAPGVGGNGGLALGGAVFVANGSSITVKGSTGIASDNTVTGGAGGTGTSANGTAGTGSGGGLYVGIGSEAVLDNSTTDITITGDIYSNGRITITGSANGVVNFLGTAQNNFNADNPYGTVVGTGILNGTTSSLQGRITNSAELRFTQNTTGTFDGTILGSGGVSIAGPGTVIFTQTNSYTGGTTVSAGTLQGNTLGLQGTITNDSTVRFNQNANGVFNGTIAGTGDVIISGTGIVTFTNANTYTGATTVAGGRLQGTTGTLVGDLWNDGDVIFNQNVNGTYNDVISGTGRVTFAGSSLIIFAQQQAYTGVTTVNNTGGTEIATDTLQGDIVNNSVVTFTQVGDGTFAGDISGTGRVNVNVTGTMLVTGNNSYTGGTTLNVGTLEGDTDAIQGNIRNNTLVIFNQATDGTYAGNMSGTGGVKLVDSGRVIFTGTNSYTGNTTVDAGTLEGDTFSLQGNIEDNAEVAFNQDFNGTFNGILSGAGSVVKLGTGNVNLVGTHTYAGNTTVTAGKLSVNGVITSPVFVEAGGALGGTGTINGDLTNEGIVAPGNSIGTLNVNGIYTSQPGSTQQIEVNSGGTVPGVNNDLIDVTGDVVLNGGTVAVQTTTSVGYVSGSRYTFMQYGGTRTGTFDGATTNTPFLNATLDYDDAQKHIDFLLFRSATSYASVAENYNQSQLASYLDRNSTSAVGDFANVLDQVNLLSAAEARTAFDRMSGVIYGTAARLNVQSATYMLMQIQRNTGFETELGTPRDEYGVPLAGESSEFDEDIHFVGFHSDGDAGMPGFVSARRRRHVWNAWTTAYGSGVSGDSPIDHFSSVGNITSVYRYLDEFVKFGVFGAYNYVDVQTEQPRQSHRTNNGQFGSYLRADDMGHHALLVQSAGIDSHESTRVIQFGGIDRTARGDYDGWQTTTYGELGSRFSSYPIDIEPFLGMQYTYLRQNGFQETGADALNLNVAGINTNALWGMLGARLIHDWLSGTVEFRSVWLHNYLDSATVLNSTFAGVGGAAFSTQGLSLGRDAALVGGGFNWNLNGSVSLAANYDAFLVGDSNFHVGSGSFQYRW